MMENSDTINLLKECDLGTKMAVTSIDEVEDKISNPKLKQILQNSKEKHSVLGNELHSLLLEYGSEEKDPDLMAKGMSWFKTNMKMTMDDSDATAADLITDGCNMGIKSLYKYLNKYPSANKTVKDILNRIVTVEDVLRKDLRAYL